MKIIVDAMGGDNAPEEVVKGAIAASREYGVDIILVGKEEQVHACIKKNGGETLGEKISVINATEVVEMDDDPTGVLRSKKDSSMSVALHMLKNDEGDACISAGSTGALLAGATLIVKRINGIRRAAMAPVLPNSANGFILIDCGANVECNAEYLLQFAFMGSFYSKKILGVNNPRVALLNVGTEESKGGELQKEAYAVLKTASDKGHINFIGNIEANAVMFDGADVVVTDGFSGNIMLKTIEGSAKFIMKNMKGIITFNRRSKIAALFIKKRLSNFVRIIDPSEVGGTPMLGISKPVIKAHGSSDARAIKNAIRQAIAFIDADVTEHVAENIEYMTIAKE